MFNHSTLCGSLVIAMSLNCSFVLASLNQNDSFVIDILGESWYGKGKMRYYSSLVGANYQLTQDNHNFEFDALAYFNEHEVFSVTYAYTASQGFQYFTQARQEAEKSEYRLGIQYRLLFNIDSSAWVSNEGNVHLALGSVIQFTPRLGLDVAMTTEKKWQVAMAYRESPNWSVDVNANEVSDVGVGFSLNF